MIKKPDVKKALETVSHRLHRTSARMFQGTS